MSNLRSPQLVETDVMGFDYIFDISNCRDFGKAKSLFQRPQTAPPGLPQYG